MSYVCVVIVPSLSPDRQSVLLEELTALAQELCFHTDSDGNPPPGAPPAASAAGAWINPNYYRDNELLPTDHQMGKHLVFEICDWFLLPDGSRLHSDVCEALLLPDGCWCCDHILGVSLQGRHLAQRLRQFAHILAHLENAGVNAEVYLGDSNAIRADYQTFRTSAAQAADLILSHCQIEWAPALHLVITHEPPPPISG